MSYSTTHGNSIGFLPHDHGVTNHTIHCADARRGLGLGAEPVRGRAGARLDGRQWPGRSAPQPGYTEQPLGHGRGRPDVRGGILRRQSTGAGQPLGCHTHFHPHPGGSADGGRRRSGTGHGSGGRTDRTDPWRRPGHHQPREQGQYPGADQHVPGAGDQLDSFGHGRCGRGRRLVDRTQLPLAVCVTADTLYTVGHLAGAQDLAIAQGRRKNCIQLVQKTTAH